MNNWIETAKQLLSRSLKPIPQELNELDWKSDISDKSERLAQHISAFANNPNGGFLVFGINDDGNIINLNKDKIDEIIKKIGQDNIIIFSTHYSEVLNNNKNFKHSWEIPNNDHTLNADAYYKYEKNNIPIFSFFTNFDDSKTFIINRKKFLTLIEYEASLEKKKIKDNIYFSINEINEDKENVILNLYTTFEIEFGKDFQGFYIEG